MKKICLKTKPAIIGACLALLLPLAACSGDEPTTGGNASGAVPVIELTSRAGEAAAAVQDFNIDFFRNVALSDGYEGQNVACSPMSATMLLSLLSNAASDETAAEIAAVLGYSGCEDLNELYATVSTKLPSLDPKVKLALANSVWYHHDFTLAKDFQNVADGYYKADIFKRDLYGESGDVKSEINSWVSDNTEGLIEKISIDLPLLSVLVNAVYFKAAWKDAFKEQKTTDATFRGLGGDSMIKMMHRQGSYMYEHGENYEAVELPFGAGAFSAQFILPSGDVEDFLKTDALNKLWSVDRIPQNIELSLPRFKMAADEEINLTTVLMDMGVKSLAHPGMVKIFNEMPESQCIEVFQKTTVEFNEQGAVAAAVTWSGMDAAPSYRPLTFDRPFIFLITEQSTKTVLFAGKVMSL